MYGDIEEYRRALMSEYDYVTENFIDDEFLRITQQEIKRAYENTFIPNCQYLL